LIQRIVPFLHNLFSLAQNARLVPTSRADVEEFLFLHRHVVLVKLVASAAVWCAEFCFRNRFTRGWRYRSETYFRAARCDIKSVVVKNCIHLRLFLSPHFPPARLIFALGLALKTYIAAARAIGQKACGL
jgi:hypothetical protein